MRRLILVLTVFLSGCLAAETLTYDPPVRPRLKPAATTTATTQSIIGEWDANDAQYLVYNADISGGEKRWAENFRFYLTKAPVVVVVHGDEEDNTWVACPDGLPRQPMSKFITKLHERYSDRPMILISCNQRGFELRVPGVWYAKKRVWSRPAGFVFSDCAGDCAQFELGH